MASESLKYRFDAQNPMMVGGQAVIEGVMMRAPGIVATAVRRPDGTIAIRKEPYLSLAEKRKFFRLPVLRGAVGLIEMLIVGLRALNFSAEAALESNGGDESAGGNGKPSEGSNSGENLRLSLTLAAALLAGVAIFFLTPLLITTAWFHVDQEPLAFNLVAGAIRLTLFLAYLLAISTMKDVRRLFEYHGAEHKVVFTFERGEKLSVDCAAGHTRFHPRCGTSFLLVVMLVAILIFGLLDTLLIHWLGALSLPIRIATHLPLIPILGGVSYEFIKISARKSDTFLGRLIVAPGLWLQKITTREPDGSELEVALEALRAALGEEAAAPAAYARQAVAG
ncbi:MAG TPA: DUF1385 domain-containing protein [Bacteroidota bacterium]